MRIAELMKQYTTSNLFGITPEAFQEAILAQINLPDKSFGIQREQSINFRWGHNHDFGTFRVDGYLKDRHIDIIDKFVNYFDIDFKSRRILDVGCWTGGTSLLLSALGAEVVAIEEVRMYANALDYMRYAFGIKKMVISSISLYDIIHSLQVDDVLMAGVLYHVTDPILALRICFNQLKDGGRLLLETSIMNSPSSICEYRGSQEKGYTWFSPSPLALKRMLQDVGFEDIRVDVSGNRAFVICKRVEYKDMLKAGLSRKSKDEK
jgi:SAM-dependent methyltransferase